VTQVEAESVRVTGADADETGKRSRLGRRGWAAA
jgi:hypothetical protein